VISFLPQRQTRHSSRAERGLRGFSFERKASLSSLWVLCVLCGLGQACGRKGPPLAPIVYVPRPVTELVAKRVEDEIVVQFKVPTENTDRSSPADLERIEVYAHTGPLPSAADFLKYGTLVRRVEVKQPPRKEEQKPEEQQSAAGAPDVAGTSAPPEPKQEVKPAAKGNEEAGLVEQGWATSVREALTEKHMEIGPMPPVRAAAPVTPTTTKVETLETPGTVNFAMPVARYYTIVGVSKSRNRRGPYAGPIRVPLISPHVPPEKIGTTYTAEAISLSWPGQPEDIVPAAAAAPNPVADNTAVNRQETPGTYEIYVDVETEGTQDAPRPGTPPTSKPAPRAVPRFGYNVYEAAPIAPTAPNAPIAPTAPNAPAAPAPRNGPAVLAAPVLPLNAALLTVPVFSDPRVEFGTERCYVVRRVEMAGAVAIESAPSTPVCVTPVDKFAPAPPRTVNLVATASAVSLIWEPNTEADLAGYVVLRGEAPGDKLAPLTAAPIGDAAYVDTSIRRNRTYVYEVIAIDKVGNRSAPSNRVEESIR
jgi:hypothetical protein